MSEIKDDAPDTGLGYLRKDGEWVEGYPKPVLDSFLEKVKATADTTAEALEQARVILADPARITDAPADGHRSARVNREWVKLPEPYKLIKEQPSDMWFCPHNLGKIPRVSVFSLGGVQVEAEIEHPTENMTVVKFTIPFAGYVICET